MGLVNRAVFGLFNFTRIEVGEVVLLTMYAKSKSGTLKASTLRELRNAIEKSR